MEDKLKNLKSLLNNTVYKDQKFKEEQKRQILSRIRSKNVKVKHLHFVPSVVFALFLVVFSLVLIQFFNNNHKSAFLVNTISDTDTSPTIEYVTPTEKTFLIDWLSDSMDRGDHDYMTSEHSKLVVYSVTNNLKRGDVIYFEDSSEKYIARIVGLPDEKITIKSGQVYINGKKLDAFYSEATVRGMDEKAYFESLNNTNSQHVNDTVMKDYFATEMSEVSVQENTYFVLVDQWWRGIDSRTLGPIHIDKINGVILGYQD